MPRRLLVLMIASLALSATTALASAVKPPTVARGGTFRIKMMTESLADCVAVVTYRDAGLQLGTVKKATDRRLQWVFPVSRARPLGRAVWYVRCGLPVLRSGSFFVVNPTPSAG